VPDTVTETVEMLARNTVHLATLLNDSAYPGSK